MPRDSVVNGGDSPDQSNGSPYPDRRSRKDLQHAGIGVPGRFENERRWSTYDLLCGRINRSHRMWHHFRWAGIEEAELNWFLDHRCPPDVIGLNHYLSGERYLDEHLDRYPSETHGGNGSDHYADGSRKSTRTRERLGRPRFSWKRGSDIEFPSLSQSVTTAARARSSCDGFLKSGGAQKRLATWGPR